MRKRFITHWKFQLRYATISAIPILALGLLVMLLIFRTSSSIVANHKQQLMTQIALLETTTNYLSEASFQGSQEEVLVKNIENLKHFAQDLITLNTFEWSQVARLIFFLMLAFVFGVVGFGVLYSHRIAGPIYRLQRVIKRMPHDMSTPISVRESDEFKEFYASLETLRRSMVEGKRIRNDIIALIEGEVNQLSSTHNLSGDSLLQGVSAHLEKLKEI